MTTFYYQKGHVLKKCFGHHLLLLRMIIYSTPVLGAPVISLPEKKDFKVGFEENSNLARSRAKVPDGFTALTFTIHRYCRVLRVELGGVSDWFNLKLFTCSVWLGPSCQKAQSATPGRSPKRKNLEN